MNKPKAVLFDLGDTLLSSPPWDHARSAARMLYLCSSNPDEVGPEEVQKLAMEFDAEIRPRSAASLLEYRFENFQRVLYDLLRVGFDLPSEKLEIEYWRAASDYQPLLGVPGLLRTLNERDIRMGVVSNTTFSEGTLRHELARNGLERYFEFVMASSDYGIRKPHPRIFGVALSKLGLDPSEVWFVGDTYDADVVGSRAAGMTPFWYNRKGAPKPDDGACVEIKSWADFPL